MSQKTMSRTMMMLLACWPFVSPALMATATADDRPVRDKSLDQQLLEGLDNDLTEGLDQPAPGKQPGVNPAGRDAVGDGEDVEFGKPADPLTRIGRRMKSVEQLIAGHNTSLKTQRIQQEIIDDLAVLIKQQQQRAADQGASSRSAQVPKRDRPGENGAGSNGSADNVGPEKSTARLGTANAASDDHGGSTDPDREAWGELPKRYVQQMMSAGIEEFLPKYSRLIEAYYNRLAEEEDRLP